MKRRMKSTGRGNMTAGAGGQRTLFLMTPERRHLVVELDESYSRRELAVLLAAFRKRLLNGETVEIGRPLPKNAGKTRMVDRIVGPGFVIEMLDGRSEKPQF